MATISTAQLRAAVERAGLPKETFERIQQALAGDIANAPAFEVAHVSYYLGALLIIGAMGWFVTTAWDRLPGYSLTTIAVAYGVLFGVIGVRLFGKSSTRIPGGLMVAVAVCMTPLAVYGLERSLGWWPAGDPGSYTKFHPLINASWIVMECVTIAVAGLAVWYVRFPFITAPAAYALWFLSMDGTALIFGGHWNFHQECWISIAFGLLMLITAFLADGRSEQDFSFWFYLFGLLTFTGGLTLMGSGNQLGRAMYCLIHLAMIGVAIILQRKAFLIFGAVGVFAYLAGEAEGYFRNSFGFTISLTLIGILFIAMGIAYKRNESRLEAKLSPLIPDRVRRRHDNLIAQHD